MSYLTKLPVEFIFNGVFPLFGKFDADGAVSEIGGTLLENSKVSLSEFAGQAFIDLPFWQSSFSNRENFQSAFQNAKNGKPPLPTLLFFANEEFTRFVELKLVPIKNGSGIISEIFFSATDITEVHEEKDFFKTRCDEFLYAAENARVGLWFWKLHRSEIYSTPKCRELLDIIVENDEIAPDAFVSAIHPDDRPLLEKALKDSRENDCEYAIDCRVIRADGNIRWLNMRGKTIFDEAGQPNTMTGSLREITDQKIASEELNIVLEREKSAHAEAVDANQAKDNFLAVISHELRSSLNSILGWTQILSSKKLNEAERAKALQTIDRSARSQAKLIEDLVDSARIRSGKLKLELFPVNVVEILQQVIHIHQPAIDEKSISLVYESNTQHVEVYGDHDRLVQVFSNLLANAIKFTDENGEIVIDLTHDANESVTISINDNGAGIDTADLPAVFNQFEQGGNKNAGRFSGLGLGLSIAKILIEKHDGNIRAESDGIGHGAKFTVVLPAISIESIIDVSDLNQKEKNVSSGLLDGIRILIVEDDDDSREVLTLFLSELNANVESCDSAKEALRILNASLKNLPDIIISDLGMPEEDGYSLIRKIRSAPDLKHIPAIALSAYTAISNKREAFESGFQTYHTKPFDPDLLTNEILDQAKKADK